MIAVFRRYIIMDKVEIANAAEQLAALAIAGPNAGEVLSKLGLNVSNMEPLDVRETTFNDVTVTFVRGDWPVMSYELWTHPANSGRLWQELVNIGATPAGSESVELLRIACGIPTYGQDIRERDLPHETEQLRALNFTKGCYIGQEIVERIRARGAVHRKLTGFRISGSLPVPGTKAKADGKEVAEVTSSAALPLKSGELQVALGYVRREIAPGGKEFQLGDAKATVVELPFAEALAVTSE
jgi:aminomethyltransferase